MESTTTLAIAILSMGLAMAIILGLSSINATLRRIAAGIERQNIIIAGNPDANEEI